MTKPEMSVTREKHLDHMVKVVPFIVCAYAIQCYMIMQMGPNEFAGDGLFFLGGCLIFMISCFITYDLTHTVNFHQDHFEVKMNWLGYTQKVTYQEIEKIFVSEPNQSFATVTVFTRSGKKFGFYFVDEADKIKTWLEEKKSPEFQAAA